MVRGGVGTSIAALRALPRAGRLALATAGLTGVMLNVAMFTAFGLVPIALALMLFYTYPAGVVVVDLALGRERLSVARLVALALSFTGVVLVLVGGLAGERPEASIVPFGVLLGPRGRSEEPGGVRLGEPGRVRLGARGRGDAGGHCRPRWWARRSMGVVAGQGEGLMAPFRAASSRGR